MNKHFLNDLMRHSYLRVGVNVALCLMGIVFWWASSSVSEKEVRMIFQLFGLFAFLFGIASLLFWLRWSYRAVQIVREKRGVSAQVELFRKSDMDSTTLYANLCRSGKSNNHFHIALLSPRWKYDIYLGQSLSGIVYLDPARLNPVAVMIDERLFWCIPNNQKVNL